MVDQNDSENQSMKREEDMKDLRARTSAQTGTAQSGSVSPSSLASVATGRAGKLSPAVTPGSGLEARSVHAW